MNVSSSIWRFFIAVGLSGLCLVSYSQAATVSEPPGDDWLARPTGHAQRGEVDQLIEQAIYHWDPSQKDAAWKAIGEFAYDLIRWEARHHQRTPLQKLLVDGPLVKPYASVGGLKLWDPKELVAANLVWNKETRTNKEHAVLARVEKLIIEYSLIRGVFLSAGPIKLGDIVPSPINTVFFGNDDIAPGFGHFLLVICDGEFKGQTHGCIVIAREGVDYWNIGSSLILSGGPVRTKNKSAVIANSNVICASNVDTPAGGKIINSIIKENVPGALGPIKFFEPAQVGIEVELAQDAVRIKKLDPAKTFAKGGLRVGDIVIGLNKNRVRSIAFFRKTLRHQMAAKGPLDFKVRRAGQVLTITVANKKNP